MNSYESVDKWYESSDAKPEVPSSKPNTSNKKIRWVFGRNKEK